MDGPNQGFDKLMQSVKRINIQYANRNAKGKFFHPYIHFTQQFFPLFELFNFPNSANKSPNKILLRVSILWSGRGDFSRKYLRLFVNIIG